MIRHHYSVKISSRCEHRLLERMLIVGGDRRAAERTARNNKCSMPAVRHILDVHAMHVVMMLTMIGDAGTETCRLRRFGCFAIAGCYNRAKHGLALQ